MIGKKVLSRKKIMGSFTLEAAILLPFIILMTAVGIYIVIYVYDRAIMVQDSIAICSKLAANWNTDIELEKRPYLALKNIKTQICKRGKNINVTISGDWTLPIFRAFNRKLQGNSSIKIQDPVLTMFLTKDIKNLEEIWKDSE